jgi:thiol-disulfide isomerase/thioredoxin
MTRFLIPISVLLVSLAMNGPVVAGPEHPKEAVCTVCAEHGESHGPEAVAAMSTYEGTTYYFCSGKCKEGFDADPAGYMPQVFPRPADPVKARDLQDRPVSLGDYKGQVVLVDFWATWCKPCLEIMPKLHELESAYADQGFAVLGLSIDEEPDKVREFVRKRAVPYRIALDDPETPTWAAYRVKAVPTSFLIDREGAIVARWVGKPEIAAVETAIRTSLGVDPDSD